MGPWSCRSISLLIVALSFLNMTLDESITHELARLVRPSLVPEPPHRLLLMEHDDAAAVLCLRRIPDFALLTRLGFLF